MTPDRINSDAAAAILGDAFPFAAVTHEGRCSTWHLPLGYSVEEYTAPHGARGWRVRCPGRPDRVLRSNRDVDTLCMSINAQLRRAKVA